MKKTLLLSIGLFLFLGFTEKFNIESSTINFSEDIAPIIYENCSGCHHTGGIGPFSLVSYNDVFTNKTAVDYSISNGNMPPWPPDTSYSRFSHERVLSSDEIFKIQSWVANGAPQGDSTLAPAYPTYVTSGPTLGVPDLTLSAPVYVSNAVNHDDYVCFVIPSGLLQNRKIRAVEVEPGNPEIVHHTLVYIDPSATYQTDTSGHCMGPTSFSSKLIGEYAPGSLPTIFPGNNNLAFGVEIQAGSNVILAMHYPFGSNGNTDSTKVHLYFYPTSTTNFREIYIERIVENWNFCVAPNQVQTFNAQYPTNGSAISTKFSVYGIFPHMHLLGKSINCYSVDSNNDTLNLVNIPNWDFEWQGFYKYTYPQVIEQGSRLYSQASYDNTTANSHNPNDPPEIVCAGLNTSDEMFLVYFMFMDYQNGDETLNLDSLDQLTNVEMNSIYGNNTFLSAYPNPSNTGVNFSFKNNQNNIVDMKIIDINGKNIYNKSISTSLGLNKFYWNTCSNNGAKCPPGIYIYGFNFNGQWEYGKIILK